MKLGTKIILSFLLISSLLAGVGITFEVYRSQIRKQQLQYIDETSQIVLHTAAVERSLYQSLILLNAYRAAAEVNGQSANTSDTTSLNALKNSFYTEFETFEDSHQKLVKLLNGQQEMLNILSQLENLFYWYHSVSEELFKLQGNEFNRANLEFIITAEPHFREEIIPLVGSLRERVLRQQQVVSTQLNEGVQEATVINRIALFVSFVLALSVAVFIYRSIANPLRKLNRTARKWGQGQLNERIDLNQNDEIGELANTYNEMASSLQKNTVSKQYLTNIIDSINEALFEVSLDYKILRVNRTTLELLGYQEDELIGTEVCKIIKYCDGEELSKNENIENELFTKNGQVIPVLTSRAVLKNRDNEPACYVYVSGDISVLKKQEQKISESLKEKQVLLAEIHHRVKNNLAVIAGLIQLQEFSSNDDKIKAALQVSQHRINSIALVHEMLYQNETLSKIRYDDYIEKFIDHFLKNQSLDKQNLRINTNVAPISLSVNQAVPCALLINELISAVHKRSFNGQSGNIYMSMTESEDCIDLNIGNVKQSQIAKNLVEDKPEFDVLSIQLIETLTKQVDGKVDFMRVVPEGINFRVRFPKKN